MGLGLRSRIAQLRRRRSPEHRFVDIAAQYHIAELRPDGHVYLTDRCSQVYGGRWDEDLFEYVGPAESILHLPCSEVQFEFLESTARVTEVSGGRGLGKSYAGLLVATKNICNRPFVDGRVVSPTQSLFLVQWDKYVPLMLETGWLLGGKEGAKEGRHELWFRNGVVVQFRSGHKPGRLASWGGGWAICDEDQDLTDKAIGKLLYCLREGGSAGYQIYHQLTPQRGEALARHDARCAAAQADPAYAKVLHAASSANIFVDQSVFEDSAQHQSREQHGIEVLGDWELVRQQEEEDRLHPVFGCLVEEWEAIQAGETGPHVWPGEWGGDPGDPSDVPVWPGFVDVTREVAQRRFGKNKKFTWDYIGGVDPGTSVPNCATIFKVFRRLAGDPRLWWVVWDFFEEKGHCGTLGGVMVEAGYSAKSLALIPDFTAWGRSYLRQPSGSGVAKRGLGPAAARMLQEVGFFVGGAGRVNPRVPASVQDVLEKLDPAVGPPRMLFRLPGTAPVFENMATVVWNHAGKDFDPSVPNDRTDSTRYPISFFDPAARLASNRRGGGVGLHFTNRMAS